MKKIKNNRIIVFRIGSMGDTVVALPCLNLIKNTFSNASLTLLTNIPKTSNASPLIKILGNDNKFFDNVINYSSFISNPFQAIKLIYYIRKSKTQKMIYLMPKRSFFQVWRDILFFKIAGIEEILGMPKKKHERYPLINPVTNEVEPEASRLARCIESIGKINLNDKSHWDLKLTQKEKKIGKKFASSISSPFLAIHVGAHPGKKKSKDWGMENWIKLIQKINLKNDIKGLVIIGSNEDKERAKILVNIWGHEAINCCGLLSPRESAAVISHSKLFCGHDSGPLHLAQCVGVLTLGIFGDYNQPIEWHPIGPHVKILHNTDGIKKISVDYVYESIYKILNSNDNS